MKNVTILSCTMAMIFLMVPFKIIAMKNLVVVEDYRSDIAAEKLISRLKNYSDKSVILTPLRLNYKFITSDSFHSHFRNLLSMKNDTPDIFYMDQVYLTDFVKSGFIADLTNYYPPSYQNAFFDYAIKPAVINKRLWALPIHSEVGVIFYRKDLLNEAGLDVPKSWEDIKNASLAVMKKHPGIYGYVGQFKEYEGLVCNFLEFAWSNGTDPFETKEGDKNKLVETLQTLVDWVNKYKIIPTESLKMTEGESINVLTQNKALFLRHWPSGGLSWFKEAISKDKIGLMSLPPGPSGDKSYMVTGGWYFVVNPFSKNVKKAILALDFLNNENSQLINFETKREIPTRKSIFTSGKLREVFPAYFDYISGNGFEARNRPHTPYYSEFSRIIAASIHRALKEELTAKEAVDRIYKEVNLLKKSVDN